MDFDFDTEIDRRGHGSVKWDDMERLYGVPADGGLAMWVADKDFVAAPVVQNALKAMLDHGVYGYPASDGPYREAICWWMRHRHGWEIDPNHIFSTHGLVNAVGLCIHSFSAPGDGVALLTPAYHAFARVINASGRAVVELELAKKEGKYALDIDTWKTQLKGHERMLILCSPQNPGGRVWTRAELMSIAKFAQEHDLLLVSDEIHHDLVYSGNKHIPMALIEDAADRLIMLTSASKTFNIAGGHIGQVTISNPDLHQHFAASIGALGISANSFGQTMTRAAYSPDGAAWVDALVAYLDENRRLFDAGIAQIPGLQSMPLEATYLAWVDFSGLGMQPQEVIERIEKRAKIAANHGATFGAGGASFMRFNLGTNRARIKDAIDRLTNAFDDIQ